MSKLNYGASCVMWNFGSWKTFKSFQEAYSVDSNTFVIANVPYSRVDLFYSTEDQLLNVIKLLEQYALSTNASIREYWFNWVHSQKDILFIVDEAHLYFDSRSSLVRWNNMESMKLLLTQCRKRKIRMVFISQRLTQIDVRIRRLCDYVEEYHRSNFLWLYRVKKSVYENRGDVADIEADNNVKYISNYDEKNYKSDAKLYSEFVSELTVFLKLFSYMNLPYQLMLKEFYNTYYICWQEDSRVNIPSLQKFMLDIQIPVIPRIPFNQVLRNNLPTFYKAYDKIVEISDKGFDKINQILHTENQMDDQEVDFGALPNDQEDLQDISLKRFWSLDQEENQEVINKTLTLQEKLTLLKNKKNGV